MKIYISADIEGVAGVTAWEETLANGRGYAEACQQMTAEVNAACEAAFAAGATEIVVKDAHDTARNLDHRALPAGVSLYRGWSGHPSGMIEGMDSSFDGVIFLGYHSAAGSGGNPLAHTMTTDLDEVTLNGMQCDELLLHGWLAAHLQVPLLMVTGDAELCRVAEERYPEMVTVSVKEGHGNGLLNLHPETALERIREGVQTALTREVPVLELPERFRLEVRYSKQNRAYRASFYPGCYLQDAKTVVYETEDYGELTRCQHFIL